MPAALSRFLLLALLLLAGSETLPAEELAIDETIADIDAGSMVPGAVDFAPLDGHPAIYGANRDGQTLGYVFLNTDYVESVGYSGKPIHLLIGLDTDGVITAVRLIRHHEPIVLIGIPEKRIVEVLDNYVGFNIVEYARSRETRPRVDIVSGATVTIMVMDHAILNAAVRAAHQLQLGGLEAVTGTSGAVVEREIDASQRQVEDWFTLVQDGAVARLSVSVADINQAFEELGDPEARERPEPGPEDEPFVQLYAALVSVPAIGLSLLGEREYDNLLKRLEPEQQAILLLGAGRYSFKGSGYVRGGIFDRFQLIQGDRSVRFDDFLHKRLGRVAASGAPEFSEIGLFRIPVDFEFRPAMTWRIELLVSRDTGPTSKAFTTFDLDYRIPERYLLPEPSPEPVDEQSSLTTPGLDDSPLWMTLWRQKIVLIALLVVSLAVLTFVFFFQDWLVKRPRLTNRLRLGFLCFTLFGLGWYANVQLSIVNILTVFNALVSGFDWEYFLMEPLIFILWGSVAASLLFWGRGVFCGWLCPFGALQELLNRLAKWARIPQVSVPWWLHERLWSLKYVIFLVLFGVSLHSLEWAERLAEVEPFKTAIILKFDRAWPFVLFAVGMLAAGLFIERFYCRYLCPLGAALAIPGKLRLFEWLKRYRDCGSPCQRCARECMVQAIHPAGNINPNECHYCLHCQIVYFDQEGCPVLIQRRLKKERRGTSRGKAAVPLAELVSQTETSARQ